MRSILLLSVLTYAFFLNASSQVINGSASTIAAPDVIIIPVVVHIVYNNSDQNISNDQVRSQIKVLNQDFRKKNSDAAYKGEGWGLTNDGTHLIMSNGTSNIYYLNADSLTFIRMLAVQDNNGYVSDINELEFINGFIYANKWLTDYILKIDPSTGYVVGKMDLSKQVAEVKAKHRQAEEMNGIAYDSVSRKTYITGKKWPVIYEIKW